ncbi:MAG: 23S rRNA (uracil(1939)-C(5))-methyltransferase RlmD [Lentimicrobiaceae bacterium]|jgi:23S rRNA (uracil1939-C5)-methyltransferase|nr:23S rRNA (uracil(1939)-C(5))-methyltransferase RlmD [Lentimicrobiaceae bacterium]MBT3455178.1 23S rRNA (uracil(1939)-C(5))-methyltransferase RlmD [Lentimicrobiaceae bacterium]MBT3819580.1 23S rRNA (uracil(1939)-C(5))-methyltransferase RlmD [Lentimicrobiaceae bacterium]MBT4061341.1 23S rRNA (uracil(1939)-C(5))-methyltransferase RlmD [Lentimicrobiaceae bacterium]MBT4190378.1 23S rRNA (uracil(1939)-C(5))-methyltransferase RlmD [Lentimicrobiaceae bacterium]
MSRRKRPLPHLENIIITDAAAEGKCIAKTEDKVVFVPFTAPGDVVDIQITKKRKSYLEGRVTNFHDYSKERTEPKCSHFGLCGGCKWQHVKYENQLLNKQKQVTDSFERIAKVDVNDTLPIIGGDNQYFYRNKLEYTFSDRRWLTDEDVSKEDGGPLDTNGLGFHLPGMFDKILDIETCYLQKDPSNAIRLFIKDYAKKNNLEFYNARSHEGFLRNVIIRTSTIEDLMVIVIFKYDDMVIADMMKAIGDKFSEITSLMYVINEKNNDTIWDLDVRLAKGEPFLMEEIKRPQEDLPDLKFKVRPKSFYQTNPEQAFKLYMTAFEFADFKGDELVYDLYTGIGTIADFIAGSVKKVIGIESVEQAIDDAKENALLNKIDNVEFFVGDMLKILTEEFFLEHGKPDVIVTDPPRAGMHEKVVKQILSAMPDKIIYVSCNPASQARDIAILSEKYEVLKIQPVDMFPNTHHVENVALLTIKK